MTFPEKKDGETASVRHLVASVDPKSGRPALGEVAVVVGNVGWWARQSGVRWDLRRNRVARWFCIGLPDDALVV